MRKIWKRKIQNKNNWMRGRCATKKTTLSQASKRKRWKSNWRYDKLNVVNKTRNVSISNGQITYLQLTYTNYTWQIEIHTRCVRDCERKWLMYTDSYWQIFHILHCKYKLLLRNRFNVVEFRNFAIRQQNESETSTDERRMEMKTESHICTLL